MPPKKKTTAGADEFLDILKGVSKEYDIRIGSLTDASIDVEAISTGNIVIDYATQIGGLPLGRIAELYGNPSSGKTTCALQTAANLQARIIAEGSDDAILYMDYENAIDPDYAYNLGLDMDHPSFLFAQPNSLESGMNAARKLIETGRVRLVIFDSVAAMLPSDLYDQETGKVNVALRARLMSAGLQVLVPLLHKHNTLAIFLNHSMDVIDMTGRAPGQVTTPGGKALKFYASIRIEFKQIKQNRKSVTDPLTGEKVMRIESTDVKIKVTKNKVGRPMIEGVARVRFGAGFDNLYSAMQVLVGQKVVPNSAGYYYFDKEAAEYAHPEMAVSGTGRPNIRGEDSLFDFGQAYPEWAQKISNHASALVLKQGTVDVDEDDSEESVRPTLVGTTPFGDED